MVSKPRSFRKLLPAFGLALIASLALGVGAAASASAAVPVNTYPPTISPSEPSLGYTEYLSKGNWSGSPTKYTYLWSRCNLSGKECVAVSTSQNYVPVAADVNKTLRGEVTASNSSGSSTASAELTPPVAAKYWYAGGTKLTEKTSVLMTGLPGTPPNPSFTLKALFPGSKSIYLTIACSAQKAEGPIENPAGASGLAPGIPFVLSGCTMPEPVGQECRVRGNGFSTGSLIGVATAFNGSPAVRFETNTGAGPIIQLTVEHCKEGIFNNIYSFEGSFTGIMNNATSSLEFTNETSHFILAASKNTTWLTGTSKIETTAGKSVTLK